MSNRNNTIKVNTRILPAFNTYLTFTLTSVIEKKEKPEYKTPETTDEAIVEILYEGNREYRIPQTTDGF